MATEDPGSGLARRTVDALTESEANGRRALVRADLNVPLEGEGDARAVASDARIRATLPTIEALRARGCTIVLASHLGRPGGEPDPDLSLKPVARRLEELLGRSIVFLPEPFDERTVELVRNSEGGEIYLLENLRFHPGEKANDEGFAAALAGYGEFFVQDAFGTCHRAHASTVGVTAHLSPCVAGRLVAAELDAFRRVLDPEPPFVAVLGGAKIAGKLETVGALLERAETVCLGGGMANTFLKAMGVEVGDSLVEDDLLDEASNLLERHRDALALPLDAVVAREIDPDAETRTIPIDTEDGSGVEPGWKILDVGPRTVERFGSVVENAKTVFWNGPLGVFETPPFDAGTRGFAERLAAATDGGAYTVTGGGDSLAALERADLADAVSHASTGGGAALELVSGASLPGVEALDPAGMAEERDPEKEDR